MAILRWIKTAHKQYCAGLRPNTKLDKYQEMSYSSSDKSKKEDANEHTKELDVEHEIEAEVYGIQESIQVMQILLIKSRRDTWNQIRSDAWITIQLPKLMAKRNK